VCLVELDRYIQKLDFVDRVNRNAEQGNIEAKEDLSEVR